MKATFCTLDSPKFTGGPNTWLRRLLPTLRQHKVDVSVLLFSFTDDLKNCPCYQALVKEGIRIEVFSWWKSTPEKIRWIFKQLNDNPPDVFIPNVIIAGYLASPWLKKLGIPTVGVLHSDDNFYQEIANQFVFGKAKFQVTSLVVVSEFLEKKIQANKPGIQIHRIPCGVPFPENMAKPPGETLKLIYAGRLEEEQKRISEVTRALCRVVKEVPGTEAVIYGEGSARKRVEQIIAEEAKHLPVKVGGLIDNSQVQQIMHEHHVFILLSDYEGLPIALMEAMACGLVPVCLNIRSGISELVEDQITGLLVSDREDDFIYAIRKLKDDPRLWENLALEARRKIKYSYSHDICAYRWLHLLESLTEQTNIVRGNIVRGIFLPKFIFLPPVHPAFAFCDFRSSFLQQSVLRKLFNRQFGIRTKLRSFVANLISNY